MTGGSKGNVDRPSCAPAARGAARSGATDRVRGAARAFWSDRRGATAIEYGLIATLIFLVISTSITAYSSSMKGLYGRLGTAIGGATQ